MQSNTITRLRKNDLRTRIAQRVLIWSHVAVKTVVKQLFFSISKDYLISAHYLPRASRLGKYIQPLVTSVDGISNLNK